MAMTCGEIFPLLSPQLDGELPSHLMQAVEAHVRTCTGCQSRQAQLASARDAIHGWPSESVSPAFGRQLEARLARVAIVPPPVMRSSWRRVWLGLAAAGLAAMLLLVMSPVRRLVTPTISHSDGTAALKDAYGIDCGVGIAGRCQVTEFLCAAAVSCGLSANTPALVTSNVRPPS